MNPFVLEDALAGKPVITRMGWIAEVFRASGHDLVVLVRYPAGGKSAYIYLIDGTFHGPDSPSPLDLYMAPEKRIVWVNLNSIANPITGALGIVFDSKEHAEKWRSETPSSIAIAIPVEVEV